jgi:hypothetical protein
VSTIITFGRGLVVGIDMDGVVRTGLHASLTADTTARVEIDDAVVTGIKGRDGANGNTGSIGTVVAPHDAECTVGIGEITLLDILDPSAIDANGRVMLGFAGHGACVTADALLIIDDERVIHWDNREASYHNVA